MKMQYGKKEVSFHRVAGWLRRLNGIGLDGERVEWLLGVSAN